MIQMVDNQFFYWGGVNEPFGLMRCVDFVCFL